MVFSSVPAYFDPSNWQPQQINHQIIGSAPHPAPAPPPVGPGSGSGQTRPGSMTERARLANIPIPEAALKCPRCESTNTKFCYFNNYSLTQPRHFCKTCRRYWTRGGALRTVPVGGGCRRNKHTKSSSAASKSSSSGGGSRQSPTANPGQTGGGGPTGFAGNLLNLTAQFQPPLRFPAPLSGQLDSGLDLGPSGFAGYQGPTSLMGSIEPWRLQQFPFLGSLDTSFVGGGGELGFLGESRANAFAAVKMEEQNPNLSLSRELLLGGIQANEHAWNLGSGANWAELSSFSSSSTSNHLQ